MSVTTEHERTLIILKPDAVRRGLIGKIILRFEQAGLAVVALDMKHVSEEFASGHYATTDDQLAQMGNKTLSEFTDAGFDVAHEFGTADPVELGRLIHRWNTEFLSSGPVVVAVIEGYNAVQKVRTLCGQTMPLKADPGTIRGDYSSVSSLVAGVKKAAVKNLMHASDNKLDADEPAREIEYWFGTEKLCEVHPVSWQTLA